MKKFLFFMFLFVSLFTFSSCTNNQTEDLDINFLTLVENETGNYTLNVSNETTTFDFNNEVIVKGNR